MPYTQWRQRHFFVSVCGQIYGTAALLFAAIAGKGGGTPTLLFYVPVFLAYVFATRSPMIRQNSKELFSLGFLLTANSIVVGATGGHIYAHMAFIIIASLLSLYRSTVVAVTVAVFSGLYYMLVGTVSPGLIYTYGLTGKDAFDWSLVLFTGLVLVTALSAISWLMDGDLNENLTSLENALTSVVLRDREVNELQDNVLQAITTAMYLVEDKDSSMAKSLQSALEDSKNIVTMLRSKDLLANEDFVRIHADTVQDESAKNPGDTGHDAT